MLLPGNFFEDACSEMASGSYLHTQSLSVACLRQEYIQVILYYRIINSIASS